MSMTQEDFVKTFARHCVSMGWFDVSPSVAHQNEGRGRHIVISGFIASVKSRWYFITAGHIFEDIETAMKKGQVFTHFYVDDGWGKAARFGIQVFDYAGAEKFYDHDEDRGTDFAYITLDENTKERIRANGIEPINERMWRTEMPDCDAYFMCGIPSEWSKTKPLNTAILSTRSMVLFGLDRLDPPPANLVKPFKLLYFKRVDTLADDEGKERTDLDGMSGSPIFGATQKPDGRFSYRLLGIQSKVDRATGRILIVFPFIQPGLHLEKELTVD